MLLALAFSNIPFCFGFLTLSFSTMSLLIFCMCPPIQTTITNYYNLDQYC